MQPQFFGLQVFDAYRAGLQSTIAVMRASLEQTQRLQEQQLEFVEQSWKSWLGFVQGATPAPPMPETPEQAASRLAAAQLAATASQVGGETLSPGIEVREKRKSA